MKKQKQKKMRRQHYLMSFKEKAPAQTIKERGLLRLKNNPDYVAKYCKCNDQTEAGPLIHYRHK